MSVSKKPHFPGELLTRMVTHLAAALAFTLAAHAADGPIDYRVLATSKTSTMEKELNAAAAEGFRLSQVMGGKSAGGGQEVIVAMVKNAQAGAGNRKYKLLATTKTSTMQKEMQQLAGQGYTYLDQTVFRSAFGGDEVAVIMELDPSATARHSSYRLLATNKTSTMQKELQESGAQGYELVGLTVGETATGGDEIISILRKND